ncbi:MAG: glycosyltransferase [Pseudomonadota bacterium]
MQPRISVILLTYNHEAFIAEAIDSVLSQANRDDLEIIISEDCSTDGTRAIIERYVEAHPDLIRTIYSEANIRTPEVIARAWREARGEFVAYLDGDDFWIDPQKLVRQVAFMEANPELAMCYHNVYLVDKDGNRQGDRVQFSTRRATDVRSLLVSNPVPTCAVLYRRAAMDPLPAWYVRAPAGDWPLHIIAAQAGGIGYIDALMGSYRQHGGGGWTGLGWDERTRYIALWYDLLAEVLPEEHGPAIEATRAYWELGAAFQSGQLDVAFQRLQHALSLDSDIDFYFDALSSFFESLEQAEFIYRLSVDLAPDRWRYRLRHAMSLAQLKRIDEAIKTFDKATALREERGEATGPVESDIAMVFCRAMGRNASGEAAVERVQQAGAHLLAEHHRAHVVQAKALAQLGAGEAAVAVLREAMAATPDAQIYLFELATLLSDLGKHDEASEMLRTALKTDPRRAELWFRLGEVQLAIGERDLGMASLRECVRLHPQHQRGINRLAAAEAESA